jgi:hypothetical protein
VTSKDSSAADGCGCWDSPDGKTHFVCHHHSLHGAPEAGEVDLTVDLPNMPKSKYVLMARYVQAVELVRMICEAHSHEGQWGHDGEHSEALAAASKWLEEQK